MTTHIEQPFIEEAVNAIVVPITTSWTRGDTNRWVRMTPAQAERLAHRLIIVAAEARAVRQMTARE